MINREGEGGGHYAVKSLQGGTSPVLPPMREGTVPKHFLLTSLPQKTPLHYAALNGHHSVVEYLIKQEAVVDSKDKSQVCTCSISFTAICVFCCCCFVFCLFVH